MAYEDKDQNAGAIGAFIHVQQAAKCQTRNLQPCLFVHFSPRGREHVFASLHMATNAIEQTREERRVRRTLYK
jgi:hypothetical protein